jgi:hypothetical protein
MGSLAPEPEEATVSFVIRERAQSPDGEAADGDAPIGPLSDQWAEIGEEDCLYPPTNGEVEEAEVVIVSHHADRSTRKT